MPKRDHNRAHHRSRLRLPAYRHPAPQFARTNPRSGSGASDRHVPGQAAHQIPADRHRFGYRRTQPRHGVALLQGGIEPDRNGQGFSATDGRARKTGPGITRRDFFHLLPNHKFAKNLPTTRYFRCHTSPQTPSPSACCHSGQNHPRHRHAYTSPIRLHPDIEPHRRQSIRRHILRLRKSRILQAVGNERPCFPKIRPTPTRSRKFPLHTTELHPQTAINPAGNGDNCILFRNFEK